MQNPFIFRHSMRNLLHRRRLKNRRPNAGPSAATAASFAVLASFAACRVTAVLACLPCEPWMAGVCEMVMRSQANSTPNSLSSSASRQLSPPRRLALPLLRLVLTARGCALQLRVGRSIDRSGAPTSTRPAFWVNARLLTVHCHQPVRGRLRMQSPTPQHHAATAVVVEAAAAAAAFARLNHAAAALPPASPEAGPCRRCPMVSPGSWPAIRCGCACGDVRS